MKVKQLMKQGKQLAKKNSPTILTAVGLAGMATSTVLAVKATPKALELIDQAEYDKGEELTKTEVVKAAWKPYLPAIGLTVFSMGCIIGANSIHMRRSAVLASAYKLSQTALHEFKDKTLEVVGEKKTKEIKNAVSKEQVRKNPVNQSEVIITSKGEQLCYEPISGRYFKSDIDKIKSAVVDANMHMLNNEYISLNEFYGLLGLSYTKNGYDLGWIIHKGKIEVDFGAIISDDGTPTISIQYDTAPYYGYDRLI